MQPLDITTSSINTAARLSTSDVAEMLRERSLAIMDSINTREFEVLLDYASDSFTDVRQTPNGLIELHNAQEAVDFMRRIATQNPEYGVVVTDSSVELNEKSGLASVWITIIIAGNPTGTRKENVTQFRWRKIKGGRWVLVKHTALSAAPPMHGV